MTRHRPFLCYFAHRWTDLPGEIGQGYSVQRRARCGMHRSAVSTHGHFVYSKPYWPPQ